MSGMPNMEELVRRGVAQKTTILDASGNPMFTIGAHAYDAASLGGRRSRSWKPTRLGPKAILSNEADALRRRSHDVLRQNPWAHNGVESFVANCIGTGIRARSTAPDEGFRRELQEVHEEWAFECDANRCTSLYGLQALAVRAVVEGGECFIRIRERRPEDGLTVPLQLQVLEAEHVPENLNENRGANTIRSGIEFDAIGNVVAYWMKRRHPGENALMGDPPNDPVRVPAENVLHIFRPLRPGQIRGEPWLARVLIRLHEIDQWDDAQLVRQKLAALFAGFITQTDLGNGPLDHDDLDAEDDDDTLAAMGLEPGIMQKLLPGENITFSTPPDPGSNYIDFNRHHLRGAAAGFGVPAANVSGDVSDVNYTSLRAATIEFRRRCEVFITGTLLGQLVRPIWRRFVTTAMLSGAVGAPSRAFVEPRPFLRAKFTPQGWQWVDPQKEVLAELLAIRAGLKTQSDSVGSLGGDFDELVRERKRELDAADEAGLVFDSDPRRVSRAGVTQARPEGSQEPAVDENGDPREDDESMEDAA